MKNQRGNSSLVLIIMIVLVILVAVAALFYFGASNKNGNQGDGEELRTNKNKDVQLNVYRSDQYGFEFKFPGHAAVNDAYFGNSYAFAVGVTSKQWGEGAVVVIDHGNIGTMTLSEFVAKDLKAQGEVSATVKEADFNSYKSISVKGKNKTGYYMLHNLDVYQIYKTAGVVAGDSDKIFSSFKFIEQ